MIRPYADAVNEHAACRIVQVPASRVTAWIDGFARRHGELSYTQRLETDISIDTGTDTNTGAGKDTDNELRTLRLAAADGSWALLRPYLADDALTRPTDPATTARWACPERTLAVVLVRRGGYAVGLARGAELWATKAGTRYVQSRTAAGGWSQQRYQRRRGNQATQLTDAAAEQLDRLLGKSGASTLEGIILGGDRPLLATVLSGLRHEAPRREVPLRGDPRSAALKPALDLGRGPSVLVNDVTRP